MTLPDFHNLSLAFRQYDAKSLKRAQRLFSLISWPWLVRAGSAMISLSLMLRLPLKWALKPTVFRHFCGGETLSECKPVVEKLQSFGIRSVPDYSVEGNPDESHMEKLWNEVMKVIEWSANDSAIPFAVFKPSGLIRPDLLEKISTGIILNASENEAWSRGRQRLISLCESAAGKGTSILIDAEESWIQPAIDEVVMEMMLKLNHDRAVVFNTLQMYRHDRLQHLEDVLSQSLQKGFVPAFKLVRGAYMEKERKRAARLGLISPVYSSKKETDEAFDQALTMMLAHPGNAAVFCGSHNENSNLLLCRLMAEYGLEPACSRIWFSQLFGMSDHITHNLASAGYQVCKYLPYGELRHVIPYLLRRAQENTSVAGQSGRELSMIRAEMQRRKKQER